jgi:protein-tyrosine phosphatase
MIDLHNHLLPNVDDGSRSVDQSVDALRNFADHGVTDVVLTPHLRAGDVERHGEDCIDLRQEMLDILRPAAPAVPRLHLGFEIMIDRALPDAALVDRRYGLAGSRYYLVEFPLTVVAEFATHALERMARAGVVPVVAHPERYTAGTVAAVTAWRAAGARIQVDATTLTRRSERGRKARDLVEAGLADVLAADNHGDARVLRTGAEFLRRCGAGDLAELLTVRNPGAALADGDMVDPTAVRLTPGLLGALRRLVGRGQVRSEK